MMMRFLLFLVAPASAIRRVAIVRLQEHFPDNAAQVWRATCMWQSRLAPSRPHHSANVNMMVRYLEWCCALYRAVQDFGMKKSEAAVLVETVMSDVYRPVPATLYRMSRLRSADPATRVEWLLGMMTRHFFTAPFDYRHIAAEAGVSFDVVSCPLADYFKIQGMPELTPHAACNLDYCMAREFGVDLIRTQTIAEGAEHCDFRWKFLSQSPPGVG